MSAGGALMRASRPSPLKPPSVNARIGPQPGNWAGGGELFRAGQRSAERRYRPQRPRGQMYDRATYRARMLTREPEQELQMVNRRTRR